MTQIHFLLKKKLLFLRSEIFSLDRFGIRITTEKTLMWFEIKFELHLRYLTPRWKTPRSEFFVCLLANGSGLARLPPGRITSGHSPAEATGLQGGQNWCWESQKRVGCMRTSWIYRGNGGLSRTGGCWKLTVTKPVLCELSTEYFGIELQAQILREGYL